MVQRVKSENEISWDVETDVAVVGGGACGMIASLAAAERGIEVLLLEKEKKVGGNTSLSQGMIAGAGTRFQKAAGIDDSPDLMAEDIFKKNNGETDLEITLHMCRESKNLVEWLVDSMGIHLDIVTDFIYPGHSRHRVHAPSTRKGTQIVNELRTAISNRGNILLVQQAPVRNLIATEDDGGVIGLEVEIFGQGINRVRAKRVILACNGFGNNKEMLRTYIPEMADAFYFGHEGNTGEGIRWGMELGAATHHMGAYQAHGSVAYPHATLLTWVVIVNGGFQVNQRGRRFSNEYTGYSEHAIKVLQQEDKMAIEIFDERIYQSVLGFEDFNQCIGMGAVKRGETIEALAETFQISPQALRETLESYNRSAAGEEDPMGRRDFQGPLKPPFYGVGVTGALFHTQGGVKIDRKAQVLRNDGRVIPNLYAGGGVAVGVSGSGVSGYLSCNGLLAATVLGKIAGEEAAKSLRVG